MAERVDALLYSGLVKPEIRKDQEAQVSDVRGRHGEG
jgi:hypothetical protein